MRDLKSILGLALSISLITSVVSADEAAPAEEGFLSKLAGAVKKGATEGADNGVQMTGNVKVLGYIMMHSDLARSDQPAFCLANAESEKLITVVPVFGRPYQRADGTTGFTQMAKPIDPHHDKIEVNVLNVLPGMNCADLIAQRKLTASTVSGSTNNDATTAAGSGSNAGSVDPSKQCTYFQKATGDGTGDQWCMMQDGMVIGRSHYTMNKATGNYEETLTRLKKPVSIGILTSGGSVDSNGDVVLPANVQAGWDKVDRIQKEGMEKIQADSAARESANADKAMLRKAAFEKCKPLIHGDNSQMDAFKACVKSATN